MLTMTEIRYSCVIIRPAKNGFIVEGHYPDHLKDTDKWAAKSAEEASKIVTAICKKIENA